MYVTSGCYWPHRRLNGLGIIHGYHHKAKQNKICLHPRDLNNLIKREHYPMPTIEEIVSRLPQATVFSTLDATCGYWQIPEDEKSLKLLTFNTPYGCFLFCCLPFGRSSASEVFQRTMSQPSGCQIAKQRLDHLYLFCIADAYKAQFSQNLTR